MLFKHPPPPPSDAFYVMFSMRGASQAAGTHPSGLSAVRTLSRVFDAERATINANLNNVFVDIKAAPTQHLAAAINHVNSRPRWPVGNRHLPLPHMSMCGWRDIRPMQGCGQPSPVGEEAKASAVRALVKRFARNVQSSTSKGLRYSRFSLACVRT